MLCRSQRILLVLLSLAVFVMSVGCHQKLPTAHEQTISDEKKEVLQLYEQGLQQIDQGQLQEALVTLEQVLKTVRASKQRGYEAAVLNDLGRVYTQRQQYPLALTSYQQALTIAREVDDLALTREVLSRIGLVYYQQREYTQAVEFFRQAFVLSKVIDDPKGEAELLSNVGSLLEAKQQPELAIAFYKQAVNLIEKIRLNLPNLPQQSLQEPLQKLRQSYVKKYGDTYRRLANLLLQKNRILEAQLAVDLLKVQELDDYLLNVPGNSKTALGIAYLQPEQQLMEQYNSQLDQVVQLGKELSELQKIPTKQRTPQQEERRQQLEATQRETIKEFLKFSDSPEVVAHVQELSRTTGGENLNPKQLRRLQTSLQQLGTDIVLLYPLILEDRLELVLVTPFTPPIHRPVAVSKTELSLAITEFRDVLTNPAKDATSPAQKLYNWLIKPIEPALKATKAKTIIYAPDGQLRYIPLAALHDGQQWLTQKYQISNITALSLIGLNKPSQTLRILAGAFSKGTYDVRVGSRTFKYGGLPFAAKEVEDLTAAFPGSTKLLNSSFTKEATIKNLSNYSIIHFATHAAFVTGAPDDSFILFGDGDAAHLQDLRLWDLSQTDLVVLSACETGLGGKLGDGIEILGFGYVMQEAGTRAAVASLWQVADDATQALMNAFYSELQQNKLKPTEAMQKAQISLIDYIYQHPYYWAGFIVIGNSF